MSALTAPTKFDALVMEWVQGTAALNTFDKIDVLCAALEAVDVKADLFQVTSAASPAPRAGVVSAAMGTKPRRPSAATPKKIREEAAEKLREDLAALVAALESQAQHEYEEEMGGTVTLALAENTQNCQRNDAAEENENENEDEALEHFGEEANGHAVCTADDCDEAPGPETCLDYADADGEPLEDANGTADGQNGRAFEDAPAEQGASEQQEQEADVAAVADASTSGAVAEDAAGDVPQQEAAASTSETNEATHIDTTAGASDINAEADANAGTTVSEEVALAATS